MFRVNLCKLFCVRFYLVIFYFVILDKDLVDEMDVENLIIKVF